LATLAAFIDIDAVRPIMTALKYLQAYPVELQDQVRRLIAEGRLSDYLSQRYPDKHEVQSDKALYTYALDLKQEYLRNAPAIDKVLFDNRLDLTHRALGLHTTISRVQGGKLKAKKEIRVAALFKDAPSMFLKMIVVHELAHFKESDHNKAFYKLCEHMLPGYHQVEFDLRVYLTWRDMAASAGTQELPQAAIFRSIK
jgi:predicted metal-dependent hydrolase